MTYTHLISVAQLQALQANRPQSLMVFDCSFDLANAAAGHEQYLQAHIPGAIHADLDKNLSVHAVGADAPPTASGGRHPLPTRERFAIWLSQIGFRNDMQAVVYDRNGVNYAGRLWWMLKWLGHDAVAVLDGGWQAWQAAGGPAEAGIPPAHFQSNFELQPPLRELRTAAQVQAALGHASQTVIDARAPARYRGEVEPLDPIAGHIPGALNRPFTANIASNGMFKPAAELRSEFQQLLGNHDVTGVVHQCGSGVSALPNLIAMEIAGYAPAALFAGSWSEWCSDPSRPVETGEARQSA